MAPIKAGIIFLSLGLLIGCDTSAPNVDRTGTGPTVVFEAGLGDGAEVWQAVRTPPGTARFAWSRAGSGADNFPLFGESWPSDADGTRSGADVSVHLSDALQAAAMPAPYILVGHSIGGLYALQFAKDHPDQIAGIVLVDPRLPGFTDRCRASQLRGCDMPALLRLTLSPAAQKELDGVAQTEASLRDLRTLHDIPLTILVAQRAGLGEDPRWRGIWTEHARAFAAQFSNSRVIEIDSGHYIQNTAPDQVAAAIAALVRCNAAHAADICVR